MDNDLQKFVNQEKERIRIERDVCLAAGGVYATAVHSLTRVANEIGLCYDTMMVELGRCSKYSGSRISVGGDPIVDGEQLWRDYETVTGSKITRASRLNPFRCSC